MPDFETLAETESAVVGETSDLSLDFPAMHAVAAIHRAGNAFTDAVTRDVLRAHDLTWTGFQVLWDLWIWEERESFQVAESADISKATLTGVVKTLSSRGWVQRSVPADDRRRVNLSLTSAGEELMEVLFPEVNAYQSEAMAGLSKRDVKQLTDLLHKVIRAYE